MAAPFTRIIAATCETFSTHAYWHDGAIVCGCCDAPVYDARCDGCEIVFVGEPPAVPVLTYGERRQAHFDAHSNALPIINNLGKQGVGI